DFDMVYGHRRDAEGYARCLERLDARLPEVTATLGDDDWLFIPADHGCDPTAPGTDHTREFTPLVAFSPGGTAGHRLADRTTFADLGATIADLFGVPPVGPGHSFARELRGSGRPGRSPDPGRQAAPATVAAGSREAGASPREAICPWACNATCPWEGGPPRHHRHGPRPSLAVGAAIVEDVSTTHRTVISPWPHRAATMPEVFEHSAW